MVNVTIYSIHGSYGIAGWKKGFHRIRTDDLGNKKESPHDDTSIYFSS